MERYKNHGLSSSGSRNSQGTSSNPSQSSAYIESINFSDYIIKSQNATSLSPQPMAFTSDLTSSDQIGGISANSSQRSTKSPRTNIRLMPVKLKDIVEMLKNNPAYSDKSPMVIEMKKNDIDQITEQQENANFMRSSASNQWLLRQSGQDDSVLMSMRQSEQRKSLEQVNSPIYNPKTTKNESLTRSSNQSPNLTKPPLGEAQAHQIYAMTSHSVGSKGFRARKRYRERPSRRKMSPKRSRSKKPSKSKTRSRSSRRKPGFRRGFRSRSKSPVLVVKKRRYPIMDDRCDPYLMCENTRTTSRPRYVKNRAVSGRPVYTRNKMVRKRSRSGKQPIGNLKYVVSQQEIMQPQMPFTCDCNLCMDELQFIQPSVCTKRRDMWTNEYAIIPKKQINFIDPCKELDPLIYPRANNPCVRDGHGNPLTDCIGRPLVDPVGKKFLNFSANGSVLDTNYRGNFYTGQPPLCVKRPLPTNTCSADPTYNWWMNTGYPVQPDMNPFC